MGLIGRILSFVRAERNQANISDVKFDPGGGPNKTAEHFADPGDDSHPLLTDYVFTAPSPQSGRQAAVGYVDPINMPISQPGEKRIYSRDSNGAPVANVWLKADGEAHTSNENGSITIYPDGTIILTNQPAKITIDATGAIKGNNTAGVFELQPGGDFVVNGVTISKTGVVTVPQSLNLNGKEIAEHRHPQANDSGGDSEPDTGANI